MVVRAVCAGVWLNEWLNNASMKAFPRFMICGVVTAVLSLCSMVAAAQQLNARVPVNRNQIQGTDASVVDELQQTLTQFIND